MAQYHSKGGGGSGGLPAASQAEQEAGEIDTVADVPMYNALRKIGDGWALGTGGDSRGVDAVDLLGFRSNADRVASGSRSALIGGADNLASGNYSVVIGGYGNVASGLYSAIFGGFGGVADKLGQVSQSGGAITFPGDAQTSVLVMRQQTLDSTPTEMYLDPESNIRCPIAADFAWAFRIMVAAHCINVRGENAAYEFVGMIYNNDGTTALVGSVAKTEIAEDDAAWDCDVTADDTNDALIITVTGAELRAINWVARIELTEVGGYEETIFGNMNVASAGTTAVNGLYLKAGTVNGKESYTYDIWTIYWDSSEEQWSLWDGADAYYLSNSDVETPDLAVWFAEEGNNPAPTITAV